MTFKEFISAILEKLACKHDWEQWCTTTIVNEFDTIIGHVYHFKCKKCGKFKKVKSY